MSPAMAQMFDEIRSAWRYRWTAIAVAGTLALAGWVVVFMLPDRFEAAASVFVDTSTALKPALKGLTAEQDVDAQINFVRQSLLAGPPLERLAVDSGVLPASVSDPAQRDAILTQFSNRIDFSVASAGTAGDPRSTAGTIYSIDYTDPSRARALRVVKTLLGEFITQTLGGKRAGAQHAQSFLESQIQYYGARLSAAEDRLAAFKKKNVGLLPSDQGGFFVQLQTETDAAKKVETELAIALSQREELTRQLHSDAAISGVGMVGTLPGARGAPGGGLDTFSQIQETQATLDRLLQKYTDKYPDVIATRAALVQLKQRRARELASLRSGNPSAIADSGVGNSPVYQSIELQRNTVDVQIAALRREVAEHRATVAQLRQRLNIAPQVDAQYQQLTRDFTANQTEYNALLASYQKARLGEQADTAGSVRFQVVEPPGSPPDPVWPKRTLWLTLIWLAALAGGAAVAFALQRLRPVVGSLSTVATLTTFPVLGGVGAGFPTYGHVLARRHVVGFCVATGVLLIALIGAVVLSDAGVRFHSAPAHVEVST